MSNNIKIVEFGQNVILYSYGVPVAAFVPGTGFVKRAQRYSKTTSAHANAFVANKFGTASPRTSVTVVDDEQFFNLTGIRAQR